jgi:ketopantoate reductase
VRVKSHKLKDKLIEIVIKDPDILLEINAFYSVSGLNENDYLILHTKSIFVANALKANGILSEDKRKSLTDTYINQKY